MKKGQFDSCPSGCCFSSLPSAYTKSLIFKDSTFESSSPFLIRQIEYYQQFLDPQMKKKLHVKRICRYTPTCSQYTKMAIKRHGAVKGIAMGIYRLLRCNPFSKGGHDPVKP